MSLDTYIEGVAKYLKAPNSVNEDDFIAWCEQRWYSRKNGVKSYYEATLKEHAAKYEEYIRVALPNEDRHRVVSPRTA